MGPFYILSKINLSKYSQKKVTFQTNKGYVSTIANHLKVYVTEYVVMTVTMELM
jgi:hypothetical protein